MSCPRLAAAARFPSFLFPLYNDQPEPHRQARANCLTMDSPHATTDSREGYFVFRSPSLKEEQLGWRDARISQRHRLWGVCPATDLDFALLEYSNSRAVALIDYKYRSFRMDLDHPSLLALGTLTSNSHIPAWIAEYDPDGWTVKLHELNSEALDYMEVHPHTFRRLTEEQFVFLLHDLRGVTVPQEVLETLRRVETN